MEQRYDVIVVGAGHAGCEAACAAANLGSRTLLITMDMNKIAQMSCNPAVGGIAKGQIVREIDALGGYMGRITDETSIQFRMLNRSKGPAMWSPRAQSDRMKFSMRWREIIEHLPNLYMWQDTVTSLLLEEERVTGVATAMGVTFTAASVVLTTGTFMGGMLHFGATQLPGGRIAEPASHGITEQMKAAGMEVARMKTGTPVRIDGRSIDFSLCTKQEGESDFHRFSFGPAPATRLIQRACWSVHTNEEVHRVLREGLPFSPLFNGQIQSIGPRYCPSIETKIVTFAEKTSHQLFIEPEGETTEEYYLNGFSSSLPIDIQVEALKKIPAFRHIHIYRPGYAIEYDFFPPTQLTHSLQTKRFAGLFMAGQINGTTGYEEAAGQGLMAGINAHLQSRGEAPFMLQRNEAYIGVLIDDLVTKGVDEPYRMFTSRAEYRILLRQDNADTRLTPKGYALGLVSEEMYQSYLLKECETKRIIEFSKSQLINSEQINETLIAYQTSPLRFNVKLAELLTRPQLSFEVLAPHIPALAVEIESVMHRRDEVIEAAEIAIKYQGYIEREELIADKIRRLDKIFIRGKFDYTTLLSLSTEARQKLTKIDPETIGQASRIPGISPSDINILLVLLGR